MRQLARSVLLIVAAVFVCGHLDAAPLQIGPERAIAPGTSAQRSDGNAVAIAGGEEGFLAVFNTSAVVPTLMRRYDPRGRMIDGEAVPLPAAFKSPAVAWNGSQFVVAGLVDDGVYAVRIRPDGTIVDRIPQRLATPAYAYDVRIASSGSSVLVTWVTRTFNTETLYGVLTAPSLEIIRTEFVVGTRDVTGVDALDHDASQSIASDGRSYLVAWESLAAPASHTFFVVGADGVASTGATITPGGQVLQPRLVFDRTGYIAVWHDRNSITAMRVAANGTPQGGRFGLVSTGGIRDFAVSTNSLELGLVWTAKSKTACAATAAENRAVWTERFDDLFNPATEPRMLQDGNTDSRIPAGASAGNALEMLSAWISTTCDQRTTVRSSAILARREETLSLTGGPAAQLQPAAASDGANVLAAWIEQRDLNFVPHVYAALLSPDAQVVLAPFALTAGDGQYSSPSVAFGGDRYLVIWKSSTTIIGRLVAPNGSVMSDAFAIGAAPGVPEVVWDGRDFVVVWADDAVRSARVGISGIVTPGPWLTQQGSITLGDVVAGPRGEIGVLYRTETATQVAIRLATLGSTWSEPQTLATAQRPCADSACADYFPLAIGWSGMRYLSTWVWTGGAGRGVGIEAAVQGGAVRRLLNSYSSSYAPDSASGQLVWNANHYLFLHRMAGVSSSVPMTYVARLSESGTPLDVLDSRLTESDAGASPDLALVTAGRAVAVYNRLDGLTQRLMARSVTNKVTERQRSTRH